MDPERWARVQEVFERVADLGPEERTSLLAELSEGDRELQQEVESLLGAEAKAESFLETPLATASLGFSAEQGRAEEEPAVPERIGPYRVLGEIGSGGMGTVYRAEREGLPRTVALKVVRSSLDGALLRRRFRQEQAILAGLEHAAIARLYETGRAEDGRPYLAMELVSGLPLLAHAERRGLSLRQRLELFLEVCQAVAYAHSRGVLHRDLKPSNILVDEAGRPKLLDFGVAKLLDPAAGEGEPTLTLAPLLTPEYASPEQVRGEAIGPASDVYSLGVLLYELLAGQRPYRLQGLGSREVERAVCETDPQPPSRAASTAPDAAGQRRSGPLRGDLDAIVLKALRKEPGQRYATVEALAEDLRSYLEGLPVAARRGTLRYRAGKLLRRQGRRAAAIALALGALAGGFGLARLGRRPASPEAATTGRAVAVLGFTNLSGRPEQEWIAAVLTEMLGTELGAGRGLRLLPAGEVAQARADLASGPPGSLGAGALGALHRRLGSELVVLGSYLAEPGENAPVRVVIRLLRVPAAEPVAEFVETAPSGELLQLVSRAGFELRSRLGMAALSPAEARELVASRPADPEAARLYAEGVRAFHDYETAGARRLLEAAVAKAPEFAPAHLELAAVLTRQGFTSLAGAEADRAAALAAKLPRREQLRIAGQRAQWNGDSAAAIAAYQDLLALEPTDLDAGLALGVAQISARKVPEALATLAKLRRLPAPLVDDPRIDLLEARAARGTPAGKAATERAVAKAEALSANLLLARARFAEGAQFWDSPQIERALPPFEEALRLARAGGDRAQEGGIQIQMGLARWRAGAVAEGEAEVAEVIARMPASELPSLRSDALEFLADMLLYRLELKRSREASEEARALCRQLEASDAELNQRGWLGVIAYLEGDLAAGRRELAAAREGLVRLEAEFYREDIALALGWLELEAGNLEAAERLARESAPESPHAPHENLWLAEALWLEGMVAVARDELPLAQEKLERARQLLEGSSLRPNAAELLLSLAERALAAGDTAGALDLARAGVDRHRPWSALALRAPQTSGVLVRALLGQGKLAEARAAFAPLAQESASTESRLHRLAVGIDSARLAAAGAEAARALGELERIATEAARHGYRATELEARLAHGEVLLGLERERGRAELSALAAEAGGQGFRWLARRAAEARAR